MSIQWFPGHMTKAFRQAEEKVKLVDMVFELVDGRLPHSSRNPKVDELIKNKKRLILFTKSDLADPKANTLWESYYGEKGHPVHYVDAKSGEGINQIPSICEKLMEEVYQRRKKKGIQSKSIRVLILGIPNVGKSSLINRLAKRQAARTGNKPGVTKGQQWIRVGDALELLDTPGVLWPKFERADTGMVLAISGAIKDEVLPVEEVALSLMTRMTERYATLLEDRYGMTSESTKELSPFDVMLELGKKRGCLQKGGVVDLNKTSHMLLKEFRIGKMGRVTLELPGDVVDE